MEVEAITGCAEFPPSETKTIIFSLTRDFKEMNEKVGNATNKNALKSLKRPLSS